MRALLAGLAVVALSACGGGGSNVVTEEVAEGPAPVLPACAGAPAGAPPTLPIDFPLPPGTVVTSSESPYESQLVVLGLVPSDLQRAATFFNDTLPEYGYELGIGDSEGNESEAPFTGNGYRGKWRVNEIPECRAVRLTLVLIEQA